MVTGKSVSSTKNSNILKKIKAESIDIDKIDAFSLYYQFDKTSFIVGVLDTTRGKYLSFERYDLSSAINTNEYIQFLKDIVDEHIYLKAGFWKNIRISFQTQLFTLVPESLFDDSKLNLLLSSTTSKKIKSENIRFYKHLSFNAVNVFEIENDIVNALKQIYPEREIEVTHAMSSFIEGCFKEQNLENSNVFLEIDEQFFKLVVIENGKLKYSNIYNFKTKEDLVYYLLFTFKELELDVEKVNLKIWGEITYDSILYQLIYKYIRNVEIGTRPDYLKFSYHFDELLDQRYFSFFSQHLCK